jgi:hypothetical protein
VSCPACWPRLPTDAPEVSCPACWPRRTGAGRCHMWRWELIQHPVAVSCANQNLSPAIGSLSPAIGSLSPAIACWSANHHLNMGPANCSMKLSPAKSSMNPSHCSSCGHGWRAKA